MKNLTIAELAEMTASNSAVPGGGSIAALCGGLGAALVEMVSNLTIGNKKYINVEEKMIALKNEALELRHSLLDDIDKDCKAFSLVMEAYKLPHKTDEEIKSRSELIQERLKNAVLIPMEVAVKAFKVIELSALVVEFGNKNAVTDGLVSAMMARTAVLGAVLNAKTNLLSIKDNSFVEIMSVKINELETMCKKEEEAILNSVTFLRP